jgi:hypothetical protein
MVRAAFKPSLRQGEGLMTSVLNIDGPEDLSAESHHGQPSRGKFASDPAGARAGPSHVLIDGIGLQV